MFLHIHFFFGHYDNTMHVCFYHCVRIITSTLHVCWVFFGVQVSLSCLSSENWSSEMWACDTHRIVVHASTFQQHFWFCLCCEIYSATTKTTFLSIMLTFYFLQYVNFMHAWNTGVTYCIWQNFAVYIQPENVAWNIVSHNAMYIKKQFTQKWNISESLLTYRLSKM